MNDWLLRALGYPEEITMEEGELCYTPRYEARAIWEPNPPGRSSCDVCDAMDIRTHTVWAYGIETNACDRCSGVEPEWVVWDRRHNKPVETMSIIPMTQQQATDLAQRLNRAWEEANR